MRARGDALFPVTSYTIANSPTREVSSVADQSVIVVGAGVAGLSTGCYAQMNGYHAMIFETHAIPGGVCTTWKRKGYAIDGCMHWLTGTAPGEVFHPMWEELGVVQNLTVVNHDEYARIVGDGDDILMVYSDIDRLEQHMKEASPEDSDVIEQFANGVRTCIRSLSPGRRFPSFGTSQTGCAWARRCCRFSVSCGSGVRPASASLPNASGAPSCAQRSR